MSFVLEDLKMEGESVCLKEREEEEDVKARGGEEPKGKFSLALPFILV